MMFGMSHGDSMTRWPALAALLTGMVLATSAGAHPENDPLRFEPHTHEGGRVIFTNIPKRCFRNGLLICLELHPLLNNRPPPDSAERPPRVEQTRD